jgi:hypothetical protein
MRGRGSGRRPRSPRRRARAGERPRGGAGRAGGRPGASGEHGHAARSDRGCDAAATRARMEGDLDEPRRGGGPVAADDRARLARTSRRSTCPGCCARASRLARSGRAAAGGDRGRDFKGLKSDRAGDLGADHVRPTTLRRRRRSGSSRGGCPRARQRTSRDLQAADSRSARTSSAARSPRRRPGRAVGDQGARAGPGGPGRAAGVGDPGRDDRRLPGGRRA